MPEPKLSLHRKLAQVMYEADRIPKNGTAPAAMGGFKFVQVGDAADVIRKALAEQKISMIPTAIEVVGESEHPTSSGKMMTTLTVRTTWTLTDGDSGESTVIQSLGSGADMGDKAAPKAQSNAMKYALLMGFLLSTGDDPEQTDTSDRRGAPVAPPEPTPPREGSLIGVVEAAKAPHDLELRQTPTGHAIGFSLKEGRQIVRVIAEGQLAEQIGAFLEAVQGKRATVYGIMSDDSWTMNAGTAKERVVPYIRLAASSLKTEDGLELPIPAESDTASRLVPEAAGEAPAPELQRPSGALCNAKGPDSIPGGAVCNQEPHGPEAKHRELASDGRVLASW